MAVSAPWLLAPVGLCGQQTQTQLKSEQSFGQSCASIGVPGVGLFPQKYLLQVLRGFCGILSGFGFSAQLASTAGHLPLSLHHSPGNKKVSSGNAWPGAAHSIPSMDLPCPGSNTCWHSLWIRGVNVLWQQPLAPCSQENCLLPFQQAGVELPEPAPLLCPQVGAGLRQL